jgi:hypothetical protein
MPPIIWTSKCRWPSVRHRALGGLAHGGEGRHEDIVQRLACGELRLEAFRAGAQRVVRQRRDLGFQRVDRLDLGLVALDAPVVGRTEDFLGDGAQHGRRRPWLVGTATASETARIARPIVISPGDRKGHPGLSMKSAFWQRE